MTTFLFVRHGTTEAVDRFLAGRAPGLGLTAEGRDECRRVASRVAERSPQEILSSPLQRTRETAEILAAAVSLPVGIEDDLNEVEFGQWTHRPFGELDADRHWKHYNASRSVHRPPGGESAIDVQGRVGRLMLRLHEEKRGRAIVLVSHADTIRVALTLALGMPLDLLARLHVGPASLSIVEYHDAGPRVVLVNG